MKLAEAATAYVRAGLCALPARAAQKRPTVPSWKLYQGRLPFQVEIDRWFVNADAVCLVCGGVSGNLEMLDFDLGGEAFEAWRQTVEVTNPGLAVRLVIEQSPSGGRHVVYRCESPISGNLKLAERRHLVDGPDEVTISGKSYRPRQGADGVWHVLLTLIETRGEGGLFLCAPTPGYEQFQGDFAELPVLTEAEREALLGAAWALNECMPEPAVPSRPTSSTDGRPGDDFNQRGDIRAVLQRHGWALVQAGDNEYWRRPGKTSGWSATLKDNSFYVFSSSAAPFEQNRAYAPFSVYTLLEHGGDFGAAASALRAEGFGDGPREDSDIDLSKLLAQPAATETCPSEATPRMPEPDPVPRELLRVPGFVSELIDLCHETAPYPNEAMTFCGALAMQAFLAGRKVRDRGDNRTNIYLLGLAFGSSGKDWIRKVNSKIMFEVGLMNCLGDRLASGEGIQDALGDHPSMFFQTDEIDGVLQSINKARDARHESLMSTLLTLYSASNSVVAMRPKAGKPNPGAIDQPNLVLFGTSIPNHYYAALSERMLTNGLFARMIILEAGKRQEGQEPEIIEVSPRIIETARWWADYRPGTGNLEKQHPIPAVVEHTEKARNLLIEHRLMAEKEYAKAEERRDAVGTTVWGRVSEQTRKLALIYAVSENHLSPKIDATAVEWASRFVMYQVRRMLFMASQYVAENPFHADCLKFLRLLRESPGGRLQRQKLLCNMHRKAADLDQIVSTLIQQGDIVCVDIPSRTKTAQGYQLASPPDAANPLQILSKNAKDSAI
jgi:hypothetical protein